MSDAASILAKKLLRDAEKLAFANCPEANDLLHCEARKGWEL